MKIKESLLFINKKFGAKYFDSWRNSHLYYYPVVPSFIMIRDSLSAVYLSNLSNRHFS